MRKKKENDEKGHFNRLLHTPRYACKYYCELLGNIILSACQVWGFVAALAIIWVIHNYGKFEISLAIPKSTVETG